MLRRVVHSAHRFTYHFPRPLSHAAPQRAHPIPKSSTVADYHSALRRSQVIHRQSSKWRHPTPINPPIPPPIAPPYATQESRSARLLLSYHDLERALASRGLNTARLVLLFSTITAVGTVLAWPRIKKWGAVEGAEVAAASLEREELLMKANAMVHEVLSDSETEKRVERVLKVAAGRLMEDEQFMQFAVQWTAKVLTEALQGDKIREQGGKYVAGVLEDGETRKSAEVYLADAIQKVVRDEHVQDMVGRVSILICVGN
eukprot:GFKZ01002044.1.p1 GENE.GFKZ01002044.1~~GFKZ01002044.1.p1  ORF type:complete len:259 (-),score=38.54 GFKZ01002044.1:72-848(-)